jgi:hypothetical protein
MLIAAPHIWIPQPRVWTPRRESLAEKLRRKWRGLFASSSDGDAMLDSSGNLVENASGDALISDGLAAGYCGCGASFDAPPAEPSTIAISGYTDDFFYDPTNCLSAGVSSDPAWNGTFKFTTGYSSPGAGNNGATMWAACNSTPGESLSFARGNQLKTFKINFFDPVVPSNASQILGTPVTTDCDAGAGVDNITWCRQLIISVPGGSVWTGVKSTPGILGTYKGCRYGISFPCMVAIPSVTLV